MAWLPISGTMPQYSTASNGLAADYYIKFYASGTTTPINMATDSTGGTTLAKCALSTDGYPISNPLDESTRFIPHIDQDYRIVMYENETDADNNTTGSAAFNIDGMVLQVTPTADASNITLRDVTIEEQDDYDRSPLFVDGTDFTAGVGPHVITVPASWTPTNADMRFYRLDNSGIVTPLTPTSTSSTTFTLAETLLSTDVIFIGDDDFRNIFSGDPEANFEAIKQPASETSTGAVEKATAAEMTAGTADKFPDCEKIKDYIGIQTETLGTSGDFTSGSVHVARIADMVIISSSVLGFPSDQFPQSASGYIPTWARPSDSDKANVFYELSGNIFSCTVTTAGTLNIAFSSSSRTNTLVGITICYNLA